MHLGQRFLILLPGVKVLGDWEPSSPLGQVLQFEFPRPVAAGDFDVFFERGFFRASQVAMIPDDI